MLTINDISENDSLESVKQYTIYFADDEALAKLAENYAQEIVDHNFHLFPSVGGRRVSDNEVIPDVLEDETDVEIDVHCMLQDSEEIGRQFSPAEFWIHALNEREDSEDAWEVVDSNIGAVFSVAAKVHVGREVGQSKGVIL